MANPDWMPKWLKWICNRLDDPFDDAKHWFHGLEVCVFNRIYKCSAWMSNQPGTKWSIKRVKAHDPEANRVIRIKCKHGDN